MRAERTRGFLWSSSTCCLNAVYFSGPIRDLSQIARAHSTPIVVQVNDPEADPPELPKLIADLRRQFPAAAFILWPNCLRLSDAVQLASLSRPPLPPTCEYRIRSAADWARDFAADAGLPAIGIALTTPDSAFEFAHRHGLTFPIYAQGRHGPALARGSRVMAVPRVAQIVEGGVVRVMIKGGPYEPADLKPFHECLQGLQ